MELVYEQYDGVMYTEEIAHMMAAAYIIHNPYIKSLGISYECMYEEFLHQLKTRVYRWTFIFFHKLKYEQGVKELVGCSSWGDSVDFILDGNQQLTSLNEHKQTQLTQYLEHTHLKQFLSQFKPKEGEIACGSAFGIMPKYMKTNYLFQEMVKTTILLLQNKGYQVGVGHSIYKESGLISAKHSLIDYYNVFVTDTLVEDERNYEREQFEELIESQDIFNGKPDCVLSSLSKMLVSNLKPKL